MRSADSREQGFSIIEVIIAVVVVAVGLAGLAALSSGTSKSSSTAKVRDQQTSIAQSLGDKIRGDAAWAGTTPDTCATMSTAATPINASWVTNRLKSELALDGINPEAWTVQATARKVDSPADGTCAAGGDDDGVLPDYYDVNVVVRPAGTTATRYPGVKPFVTSFQVSFSNRTAGGALTIQACYIWPQVDERLPVGTCGASSGEKMVILPPPGSNVSPDAGDDPMTCIAEPLDCTAYKCAHPDLEDPCPGDWGQEDFVKVRSYPGGGWSWKLTGDPTDPVTAGTVKTGTLDGNGMRKIKYLKVGRYKVQVFEPGNLRPWPSHSVPADGWATVVGGIESRVVQMYKPKPRAADLVIPIETKDVSKPPWFGQSEYDYLYKKGPYELILVPIPRGRVLGADSGTMVYTGDADIRFKDLEPGLYGAYMADPKLTNKYELSGTKQFLFVPPGGGDPIVLPASGSITWDVTFCDEDIRQSYYDMYGGYDHIVEHTTYDPDDGTPYTQKWAAKECKSPTGGPPPVGSGGSGGA
jgi:prepilin-type N-terminal cleavage/methylation domain-containing protein